MIIFLILTLVIVSAFLVMVILVQRGRGGGLAGAFGSGGGSSSAFGTKTGDVFTTLTVITFVVFVLLSMALSFQFKYASRPGAPKEIKIGTVTDNSVQLSWEDDAYTEKGYRVYRIVDGKEAVKIADLPADSTTYTDTKLDPGAEYTYIVAAWNNAGEDRSPAKNANTTGMPKVPAAMSMPATMMGIEKPATAASMAATVPATASMPAASSTAPSTATKP